MGGRGWTVSPKGCNRKPLVTRRSMLLTMIDVAAAGGGDVVAVAGVAHIIVFGAIFVVSGVSVAGHR